MFTAKMLNNVFYVSMVEQILLALFMALNELLNIQSVNPRDLGILK